MKTIMASYFGMFAGWYYWFLLVENKKQFCDSWYFISTTILVVSFFQQLILIFAALLFLPSDSIDLSTETAFLLITVLIVLNSILYLLSKREIESLVLNEYIGNSEFEGFKAPLGVKLTYVLFFGLLIGVVLKAVLL